ncbi:MAG TPA: 4-(cytidine 5'-diphospho)-2-C-methyl-D-erythritol kinase [Verrucomicrobiae bacterium]|jgi:4-diphosphocytidyl-2-C-methyl-D-erythritol kinase|nr:4-(cytidine 5'-diphospho)-2-C-methyl-D-erythritol kinase [Verrucomicrobiae bacterium]
MLEKHSCCKVNLLLNILGKRPDGFHELETIMHPVPLHDDLTFERVGAGIYLTCEDATLPVDGRNLVVKAAAAFFAQTGISEGVRIHLRKHVPVAAGLGGGSGNAATTLLALNELFGQPLPHGDLSRLAAGLGSDIPFFLQDQPALATGRGEIIQPLAPFPALRGAHLALVHPGFGISTPWAYTQLAHYPAASRGEPGRADRMLDTLRQPDLRAAARELYNSLEAPALPKYPLLQIFQEFFREQGAAGALMSGSGSSTFALFPNAAAAGQALEKFRAHFGSAIWAAALPLGLD